MLTHREYTEAMIRSKGFQRRQVVQELFGGQEALARELGVSRFIVNHVIFLRRRSARIEEHVLRRIMETNRTDLKSLWERSWEPRSDRSRRQVLKIAAVIATLGLMK